MRTIARLLATTSVLLVVAACGSASSGDDSSSSGTDHSSTSQQGSGSDGSTVVSVTLRRTGGLKPMTVDRTFAADAPPPEGFDEQDVESVIATASAFSDDGAETNPLPRSVCCDRYSYAITITYGDGSSRTFETADGVPQPQEFAALLKAMS